MSGKTLDISEARKHFNSFDEHLKVEPVIVITRHNKNAFAMVNLDYLSAVMETLDVLADADAITMLESSIQDIRAGRFVDHDEVEKELG